MQVVCVYLSQRRGGGGDRDTNKPFHLPFGSKVKFSYREKTLRTENKIILTSGSFEKRSPERVAPIINI